MRILSKVSAYKIDFDEIECMYLMIKEIEKKFDKYMQIWWKVNNIMKEINSELIYHKKYIVTKKHSTQKKSSNVIIWK